jgi:hypothetical protein
MESYYEFNLNEQNIENDYKKIELINDNIFSSYNNYTFILNNNNFIKNKKIIKAKIYIKKKNIEEKYLECPICYDSVNIINISKLICNHEICRFCNEKWNKSCVYNNLKFSCPICRKNL